MQQSKLKSNLEIISSVAVTLAAVAVITSVSWGYFTSKHAPPSLRSGLQKGNLIQALPNFNYKGSPQTLLIAMSTKCHFCSESIPFYNQVTKLQKETGKQIRVVAIFPENEDEVKQYVQQNNLDVDSIGGIDFGRFNLEGTPTMILVDRDGKVLNFWIGKVPESDQQQVIKSLT